MTVADSSGRWQLRIQLLASLAVIAVAWWASWHAASVGSAARFTFFTLWLGYIGAADALVALRTGSSPARRNKVDWLLLFAASVPVWWSFEVLNRFL